ncbi:MAG: hypothetical protein KAT85_11095 [candidate division Zixibacteria bacterium]|nr:hypothetical protein [candidate division Zixibacteria bacterium]
MMRVINIAITSMLALLLIASVAHSSSGSGDVALSYIFLDEEGNQSVNQSTFNDYEGAALSFENLRYRFTNGMNLRADFRNITLNNRNLKASLRRAGLFGVSLFHNKYRRLYDFEGGRFTKRHRTGGSIWVFPHRYVKLFGGGSFVDKSGSMTELFDATAPGTGLTTDYTQKHYNGGVQFNHMGRMLRAEIRASNYADDLNSSRDQDRLSFMATAAGPLPKYEEVSVFGGFRRFTAEYNASGSKITSNKGWGGATVALPENFALKYALVFDRSGSESDLVKTDNVSHALYASHVWPGLAQVTAGYIKDYNDDLSDEVQVSSYYFSGRVKPISELELRGEYGARSEEVKGGRRLIGDEDRQKYKFSVKYRCPRDATIAVKVDARIRENEQLGSKSEFVRPTVDLSGDFWRFASFIGGYSYARGIYTNVDGGFEFRDHTIYADIVSRECHNFTAGFGGTYYRSKRDLDVEKSWLRFSLGYRFLEDYHVELEYNVHNFDDFVYTSQFDEYYTANIVEIKIIKDLSF